jgi:hypothetical protein
VREGEGPRSSSQLAQIVRTYAEECSVFGKFRTDPVHRPTIIPAFGVNLQKALSNSTACDGGFSDHDLSDGWGFVIRDSEGVVIGDGIWKTAESLGTSQCQACSMSSGCGASCGVGSAENNLSN